MGQQGDDAWRRENSGPPQGWTSEQAPPTVIGPAPAGGVPPVPGPGGEQPAAQPFQASPWPSYQPPPDSQFGGQPAWGPPPGGPQPPWGQPQGGYGGPFPPYGGQSQRPGLGMAFQRYRRRRRRPLLRLSLIVLIVFVVGGVIAAVNQGSDDDDSGDTPSNAPTATYNAPLGSGITLAGFEAGERMNVTVSQVFSQAKPADPIIPPPAGMRLYAVQFVLKDTGSAAYSDAPGNSATIFDSAGRSFKTKFDEASACKSLPAITNIAAGASASGCVVFDVPRASKITRVRFILDSGDGPQTGIWKI